MLTITAEALAGDGVTVPRCDKCRGPFSCACTKPHRYTATDRAELERILTPPLYKRLYKGDAIRHKLMHGDTVDEATASSLAKTAYSSIRAYLQSRFSLESDLNVKNSPRPLEGTLQQVACLRLNPGWLPSTFDPSTVDWPSKLAQLESTDLNHFGEVMTCIPDHL